MAFDVQGARKAGYSDSEIADFLGAQRKFDVVQARNAGYSDGEILDYLLKNEPSKSTEIGTVGQFLRGIPAGGVNLLESGAVGLSSLLPDEWEPAARRGIKSVAEAARAPFAEKPGKEGTVARRIGEGAGSMVAVLPLAMAGPFGLAGAAGLGVAAGAGEARVRAEQGGATEGEKAAATFGGSLVGATEMLPITRLLGRLGHAGTGIVGMLKRAAITGGEEGVQEAAANIAQNMIERGLYNPEKGVFTDTGESLGYGAGTGALVSALADLVLGGRRGGPQPQQPQQPPASSPAAGPQGGPPQLPGPTPTPMPSGPGPTPLSPSPAALPAPTTDPALALSNPTLTPSQVTALRERLSQPVSAAPEVPSTEAPAVGAPPERTAPEGVEVVTPDLLTQAGMPEVPKTPQQKGVATWMEKNVVGKSIEEVQAMVDAKPGLLKAPGLRSKILKTLLTPTPPAFEEGVQSEPVSGPEVSQPSGPVAGAGEPSLELPQAGIGEQAQPAAPAGTGTPAGSGVDPAGQPTAGEPAAEGVRLAPLEQPTPPETPAPQEPTEPLGNLPPQPAPRIVRATEELQEFVDPAKATLATEEALQPYIRLMRSSDAEPSAFPRYLAYDLWNGSKFNPATGQIIKPRFKPKTEFGITAEQSQAAFDALTPQAQQNVLTNAQAMYLAERRAKATRAQQMKEQERKRAEAPTLDVDSLDLSDAEKEQLAEYGLDRRPTVTEVPGGRKVQGNRYKQDKPQNGDPLPEDVLEAVRAGDMSGALLRLSEVDAKKIEPLYVALALRLSPLLINTKVSIVTDLRDGNNDPVAGSASTSGLQVQLDATRGLNVETLLHEAVHAASERVLAMSAAKRTAQQNTAVRELNTLWEAAKADPDLVLGTAARANLSEFVTEALTDPTLAKQLQARPWKRESMWEGFKRTILRMLGLGDPRTMAEATIAAMDTIFSRPMRVENEGVRFSRANPAAQSQPPQPSPTIQQLLASMQNQPAQQGAFKAMVNGAFGGPGQGPAGANNQYVVSRAAKFRTRVSDKAATVFEALDNAVDRGLISAMSSKATQVALKQGEAADQLLPEFYRRGAIARNPDGGWMVVDINGVKQGAQPPTEVFDIVEKWGKSQGIPMETAWPLAGRMMQSGREFEFREHNRNAKPGDRQLPQSMDDADIDMYYRAYKSTPEILRAKKILDDARIRLVNQMVEVGRISRDMADDWIAAAEYIPLDRLSDKDLGVLETHFRQRRQTGKGLSSLGGLPTLVDSGWVDRPVGNALDNYFATLGWMVQQVVRTDALNNTVKQLETIGQARKVGFSRPPTQTAVLTYQKGQRVYYETPTIYHAMAFNANVAPTLGFLKVLSNISRVLRTSITALPTFTAAQLPQDIQRAIMYSGVENPAALTTRALANFKELSKHALKGTLPTAPSTQVLRELGIVGDVDFRLNDPAKSLLEEFGYASPTLLKSKTAGKLLHRLNEISRASDIAIRQAIYDQTIAETGNRLLAAQRAREIINFRTAGAGDPLHALHTMIQTIPFFNAYIQGTDILYRAMTGKGAVSGLARNKALKKFWLLAGSVASASILYSLMMAGDEEYENTALDKRDRTWILGGGVGIPVPSEIGMIFKAIPERVTEFFLKQGTPEQSAGMIAITSWFQAANKEYFGRLTPVPSAARPIIEAWMDYSIRTQRELEGTYQEGLMAHLRSNSNTSGLAKEIARYAHETGIDKVIKSLTNIDLSPIKIDNTLSGYFGTTAALVLAAGDAMFSDKADRPLHRIIGLTPFAYDTVGTRTKDEFYDLREKVVQSQNSLNALIKRNPEEARRFAQEHREELMLYRAINATLNHLKATRDAKNYLETPMAAKELSGEERLRRKQALEARERDLVKWTRQARTNLGL